MFPGHITITRAKMGTMLMAKISVAITTTTIIIITTMATIITTVAPMMIM
jgi:hypothetical protein